MGTWLCSRAWRAASPETEWRKKVGADLFRESPGASPRG